MSIVITIARVILGLIFFVFGLNGFLNFLPAPEMTGQAGQFIGILYQSGYLTVVKVLEITGGAMLLSGRFVPLGLLLLGPVVVNINLFHIFLAPEGMALGIITLVLEGFLVWAYRSNYLGLFAAKSHV